MILFLLAGLGLLFGLGSSEVRQFEARAAGDIRAKLQGDHSKVGVQTRFVGLNALAGHARRVSISASDFATEGLPLFTEPDRPKSGEIDDLQIHLRNFVLAGLRIESLDASIPDCRFDFGLATSKREIRLSQSGTGTGAVSIRDRDLEAFILHKYHEIKRVAVQIRDGRVTVSGFGEFVILSAAFGVTATLEPVQGSKLTLVATTISIDGHEADSITRKLLLEKLNPIVDLDRDLKLAGAIAVKEIRLERGHIFASGATKIPDKPQSP